MAQILAIWAAKPQEVALSDPFLQKSFLKIMTWKDACCALNLILVAQILVIWAAKPQEVTPKHLL